MIYAYDKLYLEKAQNLFGEMFDFAVYDLGYELNDFYDLFLNSNYEKAISMGDPFVIAGLSGIELAYKITQRYDIKPHYSYDRSPEFWAGYSLAYYQWYTHLSFREINQFISIDKIVLMYPKYHEMDMCQFVDYLNERYNEYHPMTNLKTKRLSCGLSQSELAKITGISVRTIQQYEQRVKAINAAKVETVMALAQAMTCSVNDIMEYNIE